VLGIRGLAGAFRSVSLPGHLLGLPGHLLGIRPI
jgi:hypothetical protein